MNAGDVIFEDAARLTHVVFPLEGVVSLIAELPGGKNVEKASIGPEGVLGFPFVMEGERSVGKSVVQVPGTAVWLSASDLDLALEQYQCVRVAMLHYAKSLIIRLMESVACNSLHTAEQRVSRWLLQAHDRVTGDEFRITQETISHLLALRRATVNAICADLMNAGAISYIRGHVVVKDRSILHGRSCTCYDRIKEASFL